MADRDRASPLRVRLSQEDHEWLAKLAQDEDVSIHALVKCALQHFRYWQEEGEESLEEALGIFEAERRGHEDERRRRLYFQREYELQSRRLHKMLRDERKIRIAYQFQLRDERKLRAERGTRLREQRDCYERETPAPAVHSDILYDPKIAKLLTLAIRSESDSEAMAAFAKARTIHRKNANLFHV